MLEHLAIQSPKRDGTAQTGRAGWYPYYPGFSPTFANLLLKSSRLPKDSCILDPWNGSGTTTAAAATCGHRAWGYDLNPVMVITAKARMLNKREKPSLWPITKDLLKKAARGEFEDMSDCDPLCTWFAPSSAAKVRHIERAIQLLLVDEAEYQFLATRRNLSSLSDIAAFFYTALFRTIRVLVAPFFASNPTWIKKPKNKRLRLRPALGTILDVFRVQVCAMIDGVDDELFTPSKGFVARID